MSPVGMTLVIVGAVIVTLSVWSPLPTMFRWITVGSLHTVGLVLMAAGIAATLTRRRHGADRGALDC